MVKTIFIFIISLVALLFISRYAIANSSFLNEGLMEGIQSCKKDEDCVWVESGCCSCKLGGGENLINKEKKNIYKLLIKPLCFEETPCVGEDVCNYEEVYCDKTCKFGERIYEKPLLSR